LAGIDILNCAQQSLRSPSSQTSPENSSDLRRPAACPRDPEVLFFQFLLALILTLPSIYRQGISSLKTNRPGLIMLRCITGLLSMYAFFTAIKHIPVVNAVLLQNTLPIFKGGLYYSWSRCVEGAAEHRSYFLPG
jgi:hypothetical protein